MNPKAETLRYGYGVNAEKIIGRVKSRCFGNLRPTYFCYLVADVVCRCHLGSKGPLEYIGWHVPAGGH